MKFKITITKEVIDKSKGCKADSNLPTSCAFAVAYNELIPKVEVYAYWASFYNETDVKIDRVCLTKDQVKFIETFDVMKPEQRYSLVGREFEVEIPDSVIEYWHGDVVKAAQSIIDNPILKPLQLV